MTTATIVTDIADLRMARYLAVLQPTSHRSTSAAGWLLRTPSYGTQSANLARELLDVAYRIEQLLRTWGHLLPPETPGLTAADGLRTVERGDLQDVSKQRTAA